MARFDVTIVGMGPVGAVIACLLARAGLSVAILDREQAIYDKPRAIVLDHEALRVLQFAGIDRGFFESVTPHTGTDFIGVDGQLIKLFDPKPPPFELGWPPNVMFIQPELEAALAEAMARDPRIMCCRGWAVTDIRQDEQGATVEAVDDRGQVQRLDAGWVIGADGANSIVRARMGADVEDLDFAEWWIVIDAWLTADTPLPHKTTQYCQPRRPATYVVGPGKLRRWEIKLLPGERPETFQDSAQARALLAHYVDVDALDLWRTAVYRFQAVVADRWREGRLLIAGDAAHTMPPFLAQGLCAGIRDAINLAWKLALVARGAATPALLDSYQVERKPHVAEIVRHAKEFGLIIGELDERRARKRDERLGEQLRSGSVPTDRQSFVPNLRDGLIDSVAPAAGELFVQPRIAVAGDEALLNDVIGPDFLIIATVAEALKLDETLKDGWSRLGGRLLLLGDSLVEVDGLIAGWLERQGAVAVIVRPDGYVYGAARAPGDVADMVARIVAALDPGTPGAADRGPAGMGEAA